MISVWSYSSDILSKICFFNYQRRHVFNNELKILRVKQVMLLRTVVVICLRKLCHTILSPGFTNFLSNIQLVTEQRDLKTESQEFSVGFICTIATIMCGPKIFFQTCVCAVLDSFIFLACLSLLLMALWRQGFLCVWFTASDRLEVDNLLFSIMSAPTSVAVQSSSHNMQAIDISFTHSHKYMLRAQNLDSLFYTIYAKIFLSPAHFVFLWKKVSHFNKFGLIRQYFPKGLFYITLDFSICFLTHSLLTE